MGPGKSSRAAAAAFTLLGCATSPAPPLVMVQRCAPDTAAAESPPIPAVAAKAHFDQRTPLAALRSFVAAYEAKNYDVLVLFIPSSERGGDPLTPQRLRDAWEGPQQASIAQTMRELKAALDKDSIERAGDAASMSYGPGKTVYLVREGGAWKIKDL
jgi:hypothetical protein